MFYIVWLYWVYSIVYGLYFYYTFSSVSHIWIITVTQDLAKTRFFHIPEYFGYEHSVLQTQAVLICESQSFSVRFLHQCKATLLLWGTYLISEIKYWVSSKVIRWSHCFSHLIFHSDLDRLSHKSDRHMEQLFLKLSSRNGPYFVDLSECVLFQTGPSACMLRQILKPVKPCDVDLGTTWKRPLSSVSMNQVAVTRHSSPAGSPAFWHGHTGKDPVQIFLFLVTKVFHNIMQVQAEVAQKSM